jgi:hypothetical protein
VGSRDAGVVEEHVGVGVPAALVTGTDGDEHGRRESGPVGTVEQSEEEFGVRQPGLGHDDGGARRGQKATKRCDL